MNVLVLGGTNFIGRHIVRLLLGDHAVAVLNRGTNAVHGSKVQRIIADRTDPESVRSASLGRFDAVVDVSGTEPRHIKSTVPFLQDPRSTRYVFISSGAVYDGQTVPRPFREDAPITGDAAWGPYGTAKAECENLLRGCDFEQLVILRPPYVYGPDNNEQREQFLWARMLADRPIFVPGDGRTQIQFCPVAYLAKVVAAAVVGKISDGVYNVAESRAYTMNEYIGVLADAAGIGTAKICHVSDDNISARSYFPFRNYNFVLDTSAVRDATPIRPDGLATGLSKAYVWFRENTDLAYEPTEQEEALLRSC